MVCDLGKVFWKASFESWKTKRQVVSKNFWLKECSGINKDTDNKRQNYLNVWNEVGGVSWAAVCAWGHCHETKLDSYAESVPKSFQEKQFWTLHIQTMQSKYIIFLRREERFYLPFGVGRNELGIRALGMNSYNDLYERNVWGSDWWRNKVIEEDGKKIYKENRLWQPNGCGELEKSKALELFLGLCSGTK